MIRYVVMVRVGVETKTFESPYSYEDAYLRAKQQYRYCSEPVCSYCIHPYNKSRYQ